MRIAGGVRRAHNGDACAAQLIDVWSTAEVDSNGTVMTQDLDLEPIEIVETEIVIPDWLMTAVELDESGSLDSPPQEID